jgi:tetratricopeptide (TPR) repeat protein/SAM-dependent methyltransferase
MKVPAASLPLTNAIGQAIEHLRAGRWLEAQSKAHAILAERPHDASALQVLGCVELNRGRYEEAIAHFERSLVGRPRDALTHFYLGEAHRYCASFTTALRHYKKATKLNPDFAQAFAGKGDALRALGHWPDAADAYRKGLRKQANLPSCLSGLGLLCVRSGDFVQAAKYFEAALKWVPETDSHARASLWSNLGSARLDCGAATEGIDALTEAVACAPEVPEYWRYLAHKLLHIAVVPTSARFREVLLALFDREDINPRDLTTAAVSVLKSDPATAGLLDEIACHSERTEAIVQNQSTAVLRLLSDSLFKALLANAPIPDIGIEILLTSIRRNLLMDAVGNDSPTAHQAADLPFVCALSRQCFLNEYVYLTTPEEDAALSGLLSELDRNNFGSGAADWDRFAIISCFVPLFETRAAEMNFAKLPEPLPVIVREQIEEPHREELLSASLKQLRPIQDAVSLAVQSQYEENPFPRWTRCLMSTPRPLSDVVRAALPNIDAHLIPEIDSPRVLIAGCGTGLQTMNVINSYKNASVVAVDLSRRSLAYGMRKLAEYGIASVRHLQADILDLEMLEDRFDLVESFGVIHHMRDPEQGLQAIAKRLQPGGLLFLGLYSAMARRSVVLARRLIAERQYPADKNGIRAARHALMTVDGEPELAPLISPASDFWTMSDCRDLVFNVEEHRFTLRDIDAMFLRADLEFLGIELRRPIDRQRFAAEYPGRQSQSSLQVWHEFETRFPDTFGDTYRLWARKKSPAPQRDVRHETGF